MRKRKPSAQSEVTFFPAALVDTSDDLFKSGFGSFMAQIVIEQERLRAYLRKIAKSESMVEGRRIAREALRATE